MHCQCALYSARAVLCQKALSHCRNLFRNRAVFSRIRTYRNWGPRPSVSITILAPSQRQGLFWVARQGKFICRTQFVHKPIQSAHMNTCDVVVWWLVAMNTMNTVAPSLSILASWWCCFLLSLLFAGFILLLCVALK